MQILENVSLKLYSTMRLGGTARFCVTVKSEDELLEALAWAKEKHLPVRVIGQGSNIVWRDEGFPGLLIVMGNDDFEILPGNQVRISAGHDWDKAVAKAVEAGLSGIEALSFIPGTAGATPVQNIGAYGQEISSVLLSVRAYDLHEGNFVTINKEDCGFGYRTSRFKTTDSGRFIITEILLQLSTEQPKPPFYDSLQTFLSDHNVKEFDRETIRDAVIAVRTERLPNPFETANNGSFFANPVVEKPQYDKLLAEFPDIKAWIAPSGQVKLAAAWLIEQVGFKDYHDEQTGMATWNKQALVLVNEHAKTTQNLLDFKQRIVSSVHDKFGVTLEQEPELLP